jgi:hypothetical protein
MTGVLIMLANLACTYVWWQAFRPSKKPVNTCSKKSSGLTGIEKGEPRPGSSP